MSVLDDVEGEDGDDGDDDDDDGDDDDDDDDDDGDDDVPGCRRWCRGRKWGRQRCRNQPSPTLSVVGNSDLYWFD